ncbi:MAG: T9SS type A sorting domain-containing protein [Bacteroidales bacterium]|nr:T9SS type A sorting domain-containing protein [Bacteroidales bacterium]
MKTIFTLLLLAIFSIGLNAQLPVDFEAARADTSWHQFANAGDAPENFVMAENPVKDGINASDSCIMFTVLTNADPWVGAWSDNFGPIAITEDDHILEMMVLKDVISRVGLKLEAGTTDNVEVLIENTVIDEWEKITFDFTAVIGNSFDRLVFFPDFPEAREGVGSLCYIDNIAWAEASTQVGTTELVDVSIYPNPAAERITVQYPDMSGVTISNVLGQSVKSLEFQYTDHEVIEVSDLEAGLYFIILDTADGMVSSKFVKE